MKLLSIHLLFGVIILTAACQQKPDMQPSEQQLTDQPEAVFIGTYTRDEGWVNGQAEGIYRFSLSENGMELTERQTVAELINPSFLAISPDKKHLYAVSEMARNDEPTGFVYAYTINTDLSLTFIDRYPTNGKAPAHVAVHPSGDMVFVSNYVGGVAMVYLRNENGTLEFTQQLNHTGSGPHQNQNASHPHMMKVSPDGKFLYIPDLGSDKIWSYSIDLISKKVVKSASEFASVAPGSGPRHMDFHPSLPIAYVMNELNSTVSVFAYDAMNGALTELQIIPTLPEDFKEWNSTADIHVHPSGKYLFGSNRGHNSIVSFSVDAESGRLSNPQHTPTEGEIPRNFTLLPKGNVALVANQNSSNITIFEINEKTGILTFSGNEVAVPTPVNITSY
jgi:6-phosphogluconolactonase